MSSTTPNDQPEKTGPADSQPVMGIIISHLRKGIASSSVGDDATQNGRTTAGEQDATRKGISPKFKFSVMPGFFADYGQLAEQSPGGKLETQLGLGILNRGYDTDAPDEKTLPQWIRFANHVQCLNRESPEGTSYKLLYVIRHGRSVHNEVMEEVGSEVWKNLLSHQDGDENRIWADAHLVEKGIQQAEHLARLWVREANEDRLPLPATIYTSPLARCLETTKLVYMPVMEQHNKTLRPIVKELLRERLTDHTCDKRSSRSWIQDNYPDYKLEGGFTEEDDLWKPAPHAPETAEEHNERTRRLLEDIFEDDDADFISLTTHSYAISAILAVIGAEKFRVGEGVLFPLFIEAERLSPSGSL